MSGDGKSSAVFGDPQSQYHYGTFQGVANYYPPSPQPHPHPHLHAHPHPHPHPQLYPDSVVGFPQPVAPPAISSHHPCYQSHLGYQAVPVQGYAIIEAPFHEARLPCCGIGMGWFLFIVGFFLGGIPWYMGAFIVLFVRVDYREKPGYVACVIASIIALFAVTFGITKGVDSW